MKFDPSEIDAYLASNNRKRPWLAALLGVTKSTVGHWCNNTRPIPEPEEKLLRLLIRGEFPFAEHIAKPKHVLEFSADELRILNILRTREGYPTIDAWIAARIRDYLAVYQSKRPGLALVAEEPDHYGGENGPLSGAAGT